MFVKVLILLALTLWGGTCIGSAISCYKKGQYGGYGFGISFSIITYIIILKLFTLIWG